MARPGRLELPALCLEVTQYKTLSAASGGRLRGSASFISPLNWTEGGPNRRSPNPSVNSQKSDLTSICRSQAKPRGTSELQQNLVGVPSSALVHVLLAFRRYSP
jgi:hypothetical protein